MLTIDIYNLLIRRFGEETILEHIDTRDPFIKVNPKHLQKICIYLRYNPETLYSFLSNITGVDYPEHNIIDLVYHIYSIKLKNICVLKTSVPRDTPEQESIESVWKVAGWFEREIYDLLGVKFNGNSNLKRIYMPEDWVGHPLRKDYSEENQYHDILTTRYDPLEKPVTENKGAGNSK